MWCVGVGMYVVVGFVGGGGGIEGLFFGLDV